MHLEMKINRGFNISNVNVTFGLYWTLEYEKNLSLCIVYIIINNICV